MIDVYAIGATLKINDLISPALLKLAQNFDKLNVLVLECNKSIKALGADAVGIRALASATRSLDTNLAMASGRAAVLERNIAAIKGLGAIPGSVMPIGGGRTGGFGGRNGGGGGIHGGNMHMNSSGGIGLSGVGLGLSANAMLPLIAAGAGIYMTKKMADAAGDFQLESVRFKALGLGDDMNKEALKFVSSMHTFGNSMKDNMMLFRDAQSVFRDSGTLAHAQMVTPLLAKMKFGNEVLYGKEGASNIEGKFLDMLRVIELRRGLNSTGEFSKQANMIQQVLTTSGGRVDATQYLNLIKTGGVAAKSLTNEAMYYQLEPIIQEMGGFRVGTGLMSAYTNLIVGRMLGKKPMEELMRLGLLDKSKVKMNENTGHIKEFMSGALMGSDTLMSSPVDFLEKTLLPAFAKKGITKENDVLRELGLIFTNRTASNLFGTMYLQLANIRKGEIMSKKAMNIDQVNAAAMGTYAGKEKEFTAAWTDFKTQFGSMMLPAITNMLKGGAELLRGINSIFASNQSLISDLSKIQSPTGAFGNIKYAFEVAKVFTNHGGYSTGVDESYSNEGRGKGKGVGDVYLDGQKVGSHVAKHMAKEMNRPQSGIGRSDGTMAPAWLGAAGNW